MRMSRSKLPLLSHSAKFLLLGGAFVLGASPAFAQGSTDPFAPPPALPVDDQALPAGQDSANDAFTFEKTPEELEEEAREEAFNAALQGLSLLPQYPAPAASNTLPLLPPIPSLSMLPPIPCPCCPHTSWVALRTVAPGGAYTCSAL